MQNKIWQKPLSIRWSQNLWAAILRLKRSSGWPVDTILLRLFMLPLLPLYVWRLGFAQGCATFYKFFMGEGGFTIYRSERDPGAAIRDDSTDAWVFQQIFVRRDYQKLAGQNQIRVIIDAGAYVGYSSIFFAEMYPHAFIYALESEESNFQALQRNTRHYPNIKAIQAALWKEDGFLDAETGQRIHAVTVKTLMDQYRMPTVDILKIDIDGAEAALFEGLACHQWLPRVRLLVMGLHDHLFPGSDTNFREAMASYNCSVSYAGESMIFDMQASAVHDAAKITA